MKSAHFLTQNRKVTTGRLDSLFDAQHKFQVMVDQEAYLYNFPYIREMALALIVETTEMLQETPWKPWNRAGEFHKEKSRDELVDIWLFLINLTMALGLDPQELYDRLKQKQEINRNRQGGEYGPDSGLEKV